MNKILLKLRISSIIKKIFGISNITLMLTHTKFKIERIFFRKKYTVPDIINIMAEMGLRKGSSVIIHSSMKSFYNFKGSAEDLIDGIINYIGPEGTLCMPAYPFDKSNNLIPFNANSDPTAAGYMAETFRKKAGVLRSLNKLHSVCAYGKHAKEIISTHHQSTTCFDELSPYYILWHAKAITFNFGMPKYYIGTMEHVCESLLLKKYSFFSDKFSNKVEFTYIDISGNIIKHKMLTSENIYIRSVKKDFVRKYFDQNFYCRKKLSNLNISMFQSEYLVNRLIELANNGITIYSYPHFYK